MTPDDYLNHLSGFLIEESFTRTRATRDRYERVMTHLLDFTDHVDAARHLGTDPAELLRLEREFTPFGAFFRVFGFAELICCLPEFLDDDWLLPSRADRRAQVALTGRLLSYLSRHRLFDASVVSCAWWEAETAVRHARRRLASTHAPGR